MLSISTPPRRSARLFAIAVAIVLELALMTANASADVPAPRAVSANISCCAQC
jgi:hypothetical protein